MELFWIIVCYIAILAVCFLVGEYLQDCRNAKKEKPPAVEEDPEIEVLPDPRQTAQMLSRSLEQLAEYFGLDQAEVKEFMHSHTSGNITVIDLEEQPPRE